MEEEEIYNLERRLEQVQKDLDKTEELIFAINVLNKSNDNSFISVSDIDKAIDILLKYEKYEFCHKLEEYKKIQAFNNG